MTENFYEGKTSKATVIINTFFCPFLLQLLFRMIKVLKAKMKDKKHLLPSAKGIS